MPSGPKPLQPTFILVECRWKKDGYKFGAILTGVLLHQSSADPMSLSDMPACMVPLTQVCKMCRLLSLKPTAE